MRKCSLVSDYNYKWLVMGRIAEFYPKLLTCELCVNLIAHWEYFRKNNIATHPWLILVQVGNLESLSSVKNEPSAATMWTWTQIIDPEANFLTEEELFIYHEYRVSLRILLFASKSFKTILIVSLTLFWCVKNNHETLLP